MLFRSQFTFQGFSPRESHAVLTAVDESASGFNRLACRIESFYGLENIQHRFSDYLIALRYDMHIVNPEIF